MCGRYNIIPDTEAWADVGSILSPDILAALRAREPQYNVAPTQPIPIIVAGEDGNPILIDARWGFIPHYWDRPSPPTLTTNCRSETAARKPMWKHAWRNQRCLIPASGWYEWFVLENGLKRPPRVPHHIRKEDGKHILFAGLWSIYHSSPDAHPIPTCSIVTIASPPSIAEIHARTPVVLHPDYWRAWIDPSVTDPTAVDGMVKLGATQQFVMHTVGPDVGNSRNQGEHLVQAKEWPEMAAQGRVHVDEDVLTWLRTTPQDELRRAITIRLDQAPKPTFAERRLWIREVEDRDDAERFTEVIAALRESMRAPPKSKKEPPRDDSQSSLF